VVDKDIENIKNFVRHANNSGGMTINGLAIGYCIFPFFTLIVMIHGAFLKGIFLVPGITMLVLLVAYTIIWLVLRTKNNGVAMGFLCGGILIVFMVLFFLLLAIMGMMLKEASLLYCVATIGSCALVTALWCFLIFRAVRHGKYGDKKTAKNNVIVSFAMLGSLAGFWMARLFLSDVSQEVAIDIWIFAL
jgi:hypothetical protein